MKSEEYNRFRYALGRILDKAGIFHDLLREGFIRISWRKYNKDILQEKLFQNELERMMYKKLWIKLKKSGLMSFYRCLMSDGKIVID